MIGDNNENKQWILKKFPVGEISEGDLVLEKMKFLVFQIVKY